MKITTTNKRNKITTTDKREAKKNNLIHISKRMFDNVKPLPKIKRCIYCKTIINDSIGTNLYNKGVCSEWCLDFIPELQSKRAHKAIPKSCKKCGGHTSLYPVTANSGKRYHAGHYRSYCEICLPYKPKNEYKKRKKVIHSKTLDKGF